MNYWKECITEAFSDAGIEASEEQIDTVASWVDGAHENYGMALGYDAIPNPTQSEVENLKSIIKKMEESHDRQLWGIREGVARRRNVTPYDVHIEHDGHITYDRI